MPYGVISGTTWHHFKSLYYFAFSGSLQSSEVDNKIFPLILGISTTLVANCQRKIDENLGVSGHSSLEYTAPLRGEEITRSRNPGGTRDIS